MEYIVYRKQVCKVKEEKDGMYVLVPVDEPDISMKVPKDSEVLREIITKEKIDELLREMPNIEVVKDNETLIENTYRELMQRGTHEDLIKVIKTTYLRNKYRKDHNKRLSDRDKEYFARAERYLYDEFSVVLGMTYDETKEYVLSIVGDMES